MAARDKTPKYILKQFLGEIPLIAELYWRLRQPGKPLSKSFSLRRLEKFLSTWKVQAEAARQQKDLDSTLTGHKVLVFSTLRYWIEHAALLSTALAGLGHQVSMAYLPYSNWRNPFNRFDLRRQNAYARSVLNQAAPLLKMVSLLDVKSIPAELPPALIQAVEDVSVRDTQYTLQVEEFDRESELYRLRMERNTFAARAGLAWLQSEMKTGEKPILLTPNGSILEMGILYQVARYLEIPVITYEFGEQRGRIWLAQNSEVMLQETDGLWQARKDCPLNETQWEQVRSLFASRQNASLWENFARRWQGLPSQGGEQARLAIGLDTNHNDRKRPVVLLAANVIGDSLTLGRQVFSESMTEWLEKTVRYFVDRPDAQLVVRIHPGERYTQGPSVADILNRILKEIPSSQSVNHIHVVAANDPVNTYDVMEFADLGLVYTTTVGMEMAMSGVPVIVAGKTHYRQRGFTQDPGSWEDYFQILDHMLEEPKDHHLSRQQVESAWNYAYRFYFEYPCPFPWHLLDFYGQLQNWPVDYVLSAEGQAKFGNTFHYLTGEKRNWEMIP